MHRPWYDSDWFTRLERWWDVASLIFLIAYGPFIIESVASDSSAWNWFKTVLWAIAVTGLAGSAILPWRTRNQQPKVHLSPMDVPIHDVQRIVDSEPERTPAVKALRETHPGLRLIDAVHLIDAAREAGPSDSGRSNDIEQ